MSKLEDEFAFQLKASKIKYEREYRFHPERRWRFDFAWPDHKTACEIDGAVWVHGRHSRGGGIESDCDKLNAALALGWKPFRFTARHVKTGEALNTILKALSPSAPSRDRG